MPARLLISKIASGPCGISKPHRRLAEAKSVRQSVCRGFFAVGRGRDQEIAMVAQPLRSANLTAVGGLTIAAHEAGPADGPVVLLAPGWPQTAYAWRHVQPILAEAGYRSLALDLPGMGGSDLLAQGVAYDTGHVADLLASAVAGGRDRALHPGGPRRGDLGRLRLGDAPSAGHGQAGPDGGGRPRRDRGCGLAARRGAQGVPVLLQRRRGAAGAADARPRARVPGLAVPQQDDRQGRHRARPISTTTFGATAGRGA